MEFRVFLVVFMLRMCACQDEVSGKSSSGITSYGRLTYICESVIGDFRTMALNPDLGSVFSGLAKELEKHNKTYFVHDKVVPSKY